ncbi:IS1182 family transposase (plasmid) [Deinococcus sp. D7000]|nr:IS1182 family transposase [Deinococcus sp. D7000]QLG13289.1 IS1182 family transposase [Deinococcus sp. D7000]
MLRPTAIPEVPADTARIARAAFPKGAPFLRLRDELGVFLTDQDFAYLYPRRGQPAAAPWRLMLISVMQYAENLTDRQAADAVRGHLAWKYALSLELDDPGLDASVLCEFRTRLLTTPEPLSWLDQLLSLCVERGLLQRHGKQRTDSTHVLAAIRVMNRLELVTECLRAALNALATFAPDWLREVADPEWYDRYGHRMENYRFPKSERGKQVYADQIGKDGQTLLALIARDDAPQGSQHLSEVLTLERCWQRQFTGLNSVIRFRLRSELVKDREMQVESPYDPEARYSTKRGREWHGYKVHVSETCDDGLPHLITQVTTTTAEVQDAPLGQQIQTDLFRRDLQPTEHWVDAGYNAAELIVRAKEQHGTEIIGPVRPNTSQAYRTAGAFTLRDFQIDWDRLKATCPQGKESERWQATKRKSGQPIIITTFSAKTCQECPVRTQCVTSATRPKSLTFQPQAQQEALHAARDAMIDPEAQRRYQRRAGIEGTLSQGVRAFGLRKCRYRGLQKARLQHVLIALAINVIRLCVWLDGDRPEGTRVSRFTQLRAA